MKLTDRIANLPKVRAQTLTDIRAMSAEIKHLEKLRLIWIHRARVIGVTSQEVAEAAGISRRRVYRMTHVKDGSK